VVFLIHFWPSNSCKSLVLAIKFQNRLSSAIQLSKPFEFGHWVVSTGGFNCFYLQVWLKNSSILVTILVAILVAK
jgi:hypothetical protein